MSCQRCSGMYCMAYGDICPGKFGHYRPLPKEKTDEIYKKARELLKKIERLNK